MEHRTFGTARSRRAFAAALGVSLGIMGIFAAPATSLADCTSIGGSTVCDGDVSHTEVGRRVIFPHGPAGERAGDYVIRPEGTLPQVLPQVRPGGPDQPPPGPRPLNRADRLTDPRHGEDFGAFEYPTGPSPLGQSPLR